MSLYRDEGVVLRTSKLGEADRIITILTRGHGKIRAVAKGVRRTKSRFGARLEPFMRVDVLIAEGRSLDVVSQAEAVAAYGAPIAADYAAYEAANVIVETIDKLASTEHEQLPNQYRLLIGALNADTTKIGILSRSGSPSSSISRSSNPLRIGIIRSSSMRPGFASVRMMSSATWPFSARRTS